MSAQETIDQQPSTPELSLRTYLERTKHGKRKNNGLVIDPSIVVEVPGFNTRVAGMGELYYSLPDVAAHIDSLAHA
ncbi:DNA-binding protein, partial [Klebsiella pneumoniae]